MLDTLNRKLTVNVEQVLHVKESRYDAEEPMHHLQQVMNECFGRTKGMTKVREGHVMLFVLCLPAAPWAGSHAKPK